MNICWPTSSKTCRTLGALIVVAAVSTTSEGPVVAQSASQIGTTDMDTHGMTREGIDDTEFDESGIDTEGMDTQGVTRQGIDDTEFDPSGMDSQGMDSEGMDRSGLSPAVNDNPASNSQ